MVKMTFRHLQALRATLKKLSLVHPHGVLVIGYNAATQEHFCKPINILSAAKRLLSCTRIEIRGLGYYPRIETRLVSWCQAQAQFIKHAHFCHLVNAHNWIKYNIASDLACLKLGIGQIDYYLVLRATWVQEFRHIAFNVCTPTTQGSD